MGVAVFPVPSGSTALTQKTQEFTSTGTWTAPANVTSVEVFLVGGGGGGGYVNNAAGGNTYGGSGGGGGNVLKRTLPVTPGTSYTITIGGGGAASGSATSSGGTGNDSSFGSLLTAKGGGGGGSGDPSQGNYALSSGRGGGGPQGANSQFASGHPGGGAGGSAWLFAETSNTNFQQTYGMASTTTNYNSTGAGLAVGNSWSTASVKYAGPGVDGFGNGGCGGFTWNSGSPIAASGGVFWTGTGYPSSYDNTTALRTNGVAPTANTGDGGHGGTCTPTQNSGQSGTNGASGYCRITYWS